MYVFKQGDNPRGIFGVGTIIGGPELRDSESDLEGVAYRALIQFERLVDPSEDYLLRLDEIEDIVPQSNIAAQASGTRLPEEIIEELDVRLAVLSIAQPTIESAEGDDSAFDPESADDEIQRALRSIRIRRGQPAFRAALLQAYGKRCVISGCSVEDVLEAAHISPYRGPLTNHVSNGLLLRADIHTLFDCGMFAIHPDTRRVVIADRLKASSYAEISGIALRGPKNVADGPSKKNLQRRFSIFQTINGPRDF